MKKEIHKYPYNSRIGDETEIFLSDQICEQVVRITYRNGNIFCTIKNRITHKKKSQYQLFLLSVYYSGCLRMHDQLKLSQECFRLLKFIGQLRNTFINMLQQLIRA